MASYAVMLENVRTLVNLMSASIPLTALERERQQSFSVASDEQVWILLRRGPTHPSHFEDNQDEEKDFPITGLIFQLHLSSVFECFRNLTTSAKQLENRCPRRTLEFKSMS